MSLKRNKYYMACGFNCAHKFSLWAMTDEEAVYRSKVDGVPFFHGFDRKSKPDDPSPVILKKEPA